MDTTRVFTVDVSASAQDDVSMIPVPLHSQGKRGRFRIIKMTLHAESGSASSFEPSISCTESGIGTVEEVYSATSTTPTPGVLNVDFGADALMCLSDADGKIWLQPGFDAGNDNVVNARFYVESIRL